MLVRDEGTIVLVTPVTADEQLWLVNNVNADEYQPMWPETVIVEPRYVDDLLAGVLDAGFSVTVS